MKKLILLFLMLFSLSIQSQEFGLVANFPFNNSVSSSLNGEYFGNNLSAFTYVADRNAATSQALSRSTNYTNAYFPNNNLPSGTSARTVSIWFKKSGSPGGVSLFEYGDGSSLSGFAIGFENIPFSNTSSLYFGALSNYQNTSYTITDNVWYHYVVTTNPSGTVQQYVNGVSIGGFSYAINTNVTQFCTLGGNFNGAVDDLKIYNREITASEVTNLYTYNSTVAPTVTAPSISSVSSTAITSNSATINYSLNANNATTTSIIRYGLTSGNLSSQTTAVSTSGNTLTPISVQLTGLNPSTLYIYQVEATNSAGTTSSIVTAQTAFVTASAPAGIQFSNPTSSSITNSTAIVSVTLAAVCANSTYQLQVSTSPTFSSVVSDTNYATGGTNGIKNHNLTGLTPNTIYYFRFYAVANQACNTQQIVSSTASFTTTNTSSNTILPIANYEFNGLLTDVTGNNSFSTNSNNGYSNDRFGNANQALNISNAAVSATIANLPIGNAARTVSVWVKPTTTYSDNIVFSYGANSSTNTYGFSFTSSTIANFAWGAFDLPGNAVISSGQWRHVVCTYTAAGIATVYIDGVAIASGSRPTWNTTNSVFYLGKTATGGSAYNGLIDDLKIYDIALTSNQVTNLFDNNSVLSSENFNQNNLQVSLYPNPANDILNIEMTNEVKSIEIYNIQGQKVKSANQKQINVSDLAKGMYMIKIQDTENAVSTKKFLKQ